MGPESSSTSGSEIIASSSTSIESTSIEMPARPSTTTLASGSISNSTTPLFQAQVQSVSVCRSAETLPAAVYPVQDNSSTSSSTGITIDESSLTMKANGSTLYFTPGNSEVDILVDDLGTFTIFNNGNIGFTPLNCSALYVVTPMETVVSPMLRSRRLNRRQNYRSNFNVDLTLVDECNQLLDTDLNPTLACREQVSMSTDDPTSGLPGFTVPAGSVPIASTDFVEVGTSFYTGSCEVPAVDSIPTCDSLVDTVVTSFDTLQAAIKAAYVDKLPILGSIASPEGAFCGALVGAAVVASGGAAAVFPSLGAAFGVTASTGLCTKAIDGLTDLSGLDRDTFCTQLRSALNFPVIVEVDGLDDTGPQIIATVIGLAPADITTTLTVTSGTCTTSSSESEPTSPTSTSANCPYGTPNSKGSEEPCNCDEIIAEVFQCGDEESGDDCEVLMSQVLCCASAGLDTTSCQAALDGADVGVDDGNDGGDGGDEGDGGEEDDGGGD